MAEELRGNALAKEKKEREENKNPMNRIYYLCDYKKH
jgi:hypothetical protein